METLIATHPVYLEPTGTLPLVGAALFAAAFLVAAVLHLRASARKDDRARTRTKVLLVPAFAMTFELASVGLNVTWWAHGVFGIVLVFYFLGDWALTCTASGGKWLLLGGLAFEVGHVLMGGMLLALMPWQAFTSDARLAALLGVLSACLVAFIALSTWLKRFTAGTSYVTSLVYLGINIFMNCCSAALALAALTPAAWILWAGGLCFLVSDAILFDLRLNPATRVRTHVPVMATYLVAVVLQGVGILLL